MALYHVGTVALGMSEPEFWRCTLRKLCALYKHHVAWKVAQMGANPLGPNMDE